MKRFICAFAVLAMLVCLCTSCRSNSGEITYATARGLGCTFEYPSNWEFKLDEKVGTMSVARDDGQEFADNVNVMLVEENPNLSKYTKEIFQTAYSQSQDLVIDSFNTYNHFIEENTFAVEISGSQTAAEGLTVYFRQYIFNKNGKGYVITFSTARRQFPSTFEHIKETLGFYA